MVCCSFQELPLVVKLINRGARPNITDDCIRTPLHFAVRKGHLEVSKKLIESGASPLAEDGLGATPLGIAIMNLNDTMSALMLKEMDSAK